METTLNYQKTVADYSQEQESDDGPWVDGSEDLRLTKVISSRLLGIEDMEDMEIGIVPFSQEGSSTIHQGREERREEQEDNSDPILVYAKSRSPRMVSAVRHKAHQTATVSAIIPNEMVSAGVLEEAGRADRVQQHVTGNEMMGPGAYALAPPGGGLSNEGVGARTQDQERRGYDTGETLDSSNSSNQIPVAKPVVNEGGNLPSASEEDPEAQALRVTQRETRSNKTMKMTLGLVLFLLSTGFILVVILVMKSRDKQAQTDSHVPTVPSTVSMSPSMAPSMMMQGDVAAHIFNDFTKLALNDPHSPQSMAYRWLQRDMKMQNYSLPEQRVLQRFALATLYYSTEGDRWMHNDNWLNHSVHECLWFSQDGFLEELNDDHVYVDPIHSNPCEIPPLILNQSNAINVETNHSLYTHLWLHTNLLQGGIPNQLFFGLPDLRSLSLYSNKDLSGPISSHIGRLAKLEAFNLGGTSLSGVLPTELGLLSNSLTSIAIINTKLEGKIPTELGLLEKLHDFLADQTFFTGTVPLELTQATNLSWIYLSETLLNGTFPAHLTSLPLEELALDLCAFSGTLPTEIGLLTATTYLSLYRNEFFGTIPTEVGLMLDTKTLYLDENHLTGTIPSQLGLLAKASRLDVWSNQLTGTIPTELGTLSQIELLIADINFLTGTIPTEVGDLQKLTWLETYSNLMTGSLPTELGLVPLGALSVNDNLHSGTIPDELGVELWYLLLQGNTFLTGTLPEHMNLQASDYAESWHPPVLNITGTGISGVIPETLCATELLSFDCSPFLCGCGCSCTIDAPYSTAPSFTNATASLTGNETSL